MSSIRTLHATDPKSWADDVIATTLHAHRTQRGAVSKEYFMFLEKLYALGKKIPPPHISTFYVASVKELATKLEIRVSSTITNHHQLEPQVFATLYNHCLSDDIGIGQLTRAQGFPEVTKSWMRKRLAETSLTHRDLKITQDLTKTKCLTLVALKRFSHGKPLDIKILSELFRKKVDLPSTHYKFILNHLISEGVKETAEVLGIHRLFGRKFMKCLDPKDLEELVYRGLYQHCVSRALDISDLKAQEEFSDIVVRWFSDSLASTSPSSHDTDRAKDPANQKFRNLVASKCFDHADPLHVLLLALLHSHHTTLAHKDYEFIKAKKKGLDQPPDTTPLTENIIAAKQMVATASNRYYEKRKSGMNPSPIRTKTRKRLLTFMEKKELALQKGTSFLGEETAYTFQVLGFGGNHLSIVDGEEDKTAILPMYVLKNFIETELGRGRQSRNSKIKHTLNPNRLLVRDKQLLVPKAKATCIRTPTGRYEAVRLERVTAEETGAIQDELFASNEAREDMLRGLEEEKELDDLNTCYV